MAGEIVFLSNHGLAARRFDRRSAGPARPRPVRMANFSAFRLHARRRSRPCVRYFEAAAR